LNRSSFPWQDTKERGVSIVAGDTKVAEKGSVDQLFISTSVGDGYRNCRQSTQSAQPGDHFAFGSMGDHVSLFYRTRELDSPPLSAPNGSFEWMIEEAVESRLRSSCVARSDPRGLPHTDEIAQQSRGQLMQKTLPVKKHVLAACEMLGFDPLYIATKANCW
jgi:hydrogenase expression/formation protein HypE